MNRPFHLWIAALFVIGCAPSAQRLYDRGVAEWDSKAGVYRDGPRAAAAFEQACDKGNAEACNRAGVVHDGLGKGVAEDSSRAIRFYERACTLGLPKGCSNLGLKLWKAEGAARDRNRACQMQERACPEVPEACEWTACAYRAKEIGFDPKGLLQKIEARCKAGQSLSCYHLALTYGFGVPGLEADPLRGMQYAQRYFETKGDPSVISLFYARGVGVTPNVGRAEELLRAPCESGKWPGACHMLRTLRAGNGAAASEAAVYHKKLCDEGTGFQCWLLARLVAHGYGVPQNQDSATGMLDKMCREWALPMACADLKSGFLTRFAPAGAAVAKAESPQPAAPAPSAAAPKPADFMQGAPQPTTYAVVIGIERYRELPTPTGARADAEQFVAMAKATLGLRPENLKVALDDRATKGDIEKLLEWAKATVPQGGRLLFFFSGHGGPDASQGTPYLIPYDGDPAYLERTAVPLARVTEALQQSRAREAVAFVDSCFSGAGGRSVLPPGARPLVRVREVTAAAQVAVLSAASGAEISGPSPDGKNGLFTQVLLDGLGRARADANGDGQITMKELTDFVRPRVLRLAAQQNRAQTPSLTAGAGAGDPVLAFGLATQ